MEEVKELQFREFDMASMLSDAVVVMLAKRRTGKSFLCRDILYHQRSTPAGIVISPTEKASPYYHSFIPQLFIHDEYNPSILEKFLKRQQSMLKKQEANPGINPRSFVVMDDCLYDNKWVKDKPIRNIFMNGRHFRMMFMLLMQYPLGITPALRSNIDYCFLLKETNVSNRKKLYDHYAGIFPDFKTFNNAMDECTADFRCLVIDNTNTSGKIEDTVFWYKAKPREDFRVGNDRFWAFAEKKLDTNYREKKPKKQNGTTIKCISKRKKKNHPTTDKKT